MIFIQNLLLYPLHFPIGWLLGSWVIWLLLKSTVKSYPPLWGMLLYSVAIAIETVSGFRKLEACFVIELCAPYFSLLSFLLHVAFWFIVLFVLMRWIPKLDAFEKRNIDTSIQS
jgi:hypothetical protein